MDLSFLLNSDKKDGKKKCILIMSKTLLEIIENLSQEEITIEK